MATKIKNNYLFSSSKLVQVLRALEFKIVVLNLKNIYAAHKENFILIDYLPIHTLEKMALASFHLWALFRLYTMK